MCVYQMGDSQLSIDSLPAIARHFSLLLYARLRFDAIATGLEGS